jgi:RNA polymerase sigma-70 factor (ECF subfamily)
MIPEGNPIPHSSLQIADLIRGCADSDEAAWRAFVTRFQKPISISIIRVARKWGAFPHECVDDLVQEAYLKLCVDKCYRLHQFSLAHPDAVEGYVKTIAVNVANDYFKAARSKKRGSGAVVQLLEIVEPKAQVSDFGGVETIEREVLLREIDVCLQSFAGGPGNARDKLIFWLYYRQGMSAEAVASLPSIGLTVKGVESVILRVTRQIRGQIGKPLDGSPVRSGGEQKGLGAANSY